MKSECNSLIDLGCGDWLLVRYIPNGDLRISNFVAINIHPGVIELNKTFTGVRFLCLQLERMDFADGQFETATYLDVSEHFEDLAPPIREVVRILRPGGYLVTSEPTESGIYKLPRFVLKGSLSKQDEKSIDYHYRNAASVERAILADGFSRIACRLPLSYPFDLFHIVMFKKS